MTVNFRFLLVCATAFVVLGNCCNGLVVPFTEDFTAGSANWADIDEAPVTHVAAGGPSNDAHITASAAFSSAPPNTNGIGIFRAHNAYDSSGDAFVGNWGAARVSKISAYFRHHETEAGLELTPFVRVATSNNFPGFAIEAAGPIPANEWTKVEFVVDPSNPLLTVEGPPSFFASTMNAVGNLQFGYSFPESFAENTVLRSFELDRVSIVPEPSAIFLVVAGVAVIAAAGRRR